MPLIPPLPRELHLLVKGNTHPGLELDRFAASWDDAGDRRGLSEKVQKPTLDKVVDLSQASPPGLEYAKLFERWAATVGANGFTGTTAGPLTLHLARASALENAGICLHRIYGFTYLPGSGLKGLARAFAETVWLDSKDDKLAAWQQIEAVFGWAPGSNKGKPYLPGGADYYRTDRPSSAGSVIFHDAWPEAWPKLVTDILNSHHPKYYSEGKPPGDWEDPVPVYFLSVAPGTKFRFAVAPRRDDEESKKLAEQARQWLIGGLTQLGAGAKTASGYGDFTVEEPKVARIESAKRPSFTATLELVTPAFLAGAKQQPEDCDLRPSTLRGQLRWWWRTMHAGFVTVEQLKAMEAAIWGDTKTGGAVRVTVTPKNLTTPRLYSHPSQRRGDPPSGTRYAAYGMDEQVKIDGQKVRKQRFVMDPGATWTVQVSVRVPSARASDADGILKQATAALWLLTRFGGVGSKSRKGFGSLDAQPEAREHWPTSLDQCRTWANEYRGTSGPLNVDTAIPGSLFDDGRQFVEIDAGRTDPWSLVERIGTAYSRIAATFQHDDRKAAFGLPRKIHGPLPYPLPHQRAETHQQPQPLSSPIWPPRTNPDKGRHTSAIHLHVGKGANGDLVVRLLALPARFLRSREESVEMLDQFARGFRIEFDAIAPAAAHGTPRQVVVPPSASAKRKTGTVVQVTILQKRAKGGFDVQEDGRPAGTLTLGSPAADVDTSDGKAVTVWIHNDDLAKPQYKWPDPPKGGKK